MSLPGRVDGRGKNNMNLEFVDYKTFDHIGTYGDTPLPHLLQRADVTKCTEFWRLWRSPAAEAVKKLIYVNAEDGRFFAYRLRPIQGGTTPLQGGMYVPISLSYQIKDVSGLLPYQPVAVSYLVQSIIDHGAAADGSDTGLGKTYQALAVCRELALRPLVICRKAGMAGWFRGCRLMGVVPYMIGNWEMARTGKIHVGGHFPILRNRRVILGRETSKYDYAWEPPKGVLLIFDEAHLGFNPDAHNYALWTASRGIASLSLSATFADRPVRLQGLFTVLRIMDPPAFQAWLLQRDHFTNQYNALESLTSVEDMKKINQILYPEHGYRLSYDDPAVKEYFPERVILTEVVDLGDKLVKEQNDEYAKLLEKAKIYKEMGKQAQLMVADLRYRQHAELLKVRALVDLARDLLADGKSVLIFVNFRETLKSLAEILHTRSMIFGDQDRYGLNREEVIESFQRGRVKIILCMTDAGGQSIDLHDVHGTGQRVSLICPTYDPIKLQQVLGRTYRAKSRTTPVMKLVYAAGTVEEKVCDVVNRKLDNIAALNNGDLMEPDLFNLGVVHGN